MLAKAATIERSILANYQIGCNAGEKYYSDLASWLKQVGHFEDTDEPICVVREKIFKRNTKKPKNLWNKTDFEIERMCDSASEAIYLAHSFHDKTRPAEA